MPKKKRREDTAILFFVFKLVGSLILVLVVAAGIDLSHAIKSITLFYGQPL